MLNHDEFFILEWEMKTLDQIDEYDVPIGSIRHNKKECYEIDSEIKRRIDKRKNNDR